VVSIIPTATTGCSVTSAIATITVNSAPTFSTPALPTQTICLDGTFNALSIATQNGAGNPTFQWYSNTSNSTANGTLLSGETNNNYTPPSNTVGTTYYYVIATFATGGCSSITSTVATAIVLADPVISAQPIASQSICVGGTISTALTASATGGTGTTSYQWSNASGAITGATSQNYTPPIFSTVGTYSYFVTITLSGSGCNNAVSQNAQIEVVADPTVATQPLDAEYCQNASPVAPLTVSATGGIGALSYQWFSNTSNSNSGGTIVLNATNSSYTPPVNAIGVKYYYCVISQTGLNCAVNSAVATITVNSAPTFSTPALPTQTICLDGVFNALTVATQNGTGTPTYQWFNNTTNTTSNGTPISGATNNTYSPPANAIGTTYYYCVATFASGGCSAITSTVATAIVVADPIISAQPIASQSICIGGTIATALTATATGGTGTTTYQWSNASGSISSATNQTYLPPNFTTVGQYSYSVTISLSGSGCNALTTQNAIIDVIADPIVSTQPIGASYCQNGSPVTPLSITASGGVNSNYLYQWFNGAAPISGAITNTYNPSVSATGTFTYTCQVSIDPSAIGCSVTSNAATIQVNPAPTFSTPALPSQTICLDGTFITLTVATQNGTGTPTYQWFSNTTNSTSNGTLIPGATNTSYTPPSNLVGTKYYYCVATFASGGCSAITSTVATAIVVADPIISAQPIASQSICVGGTIATALTASATGGTGTITYQWNNTSGPIAGATNQAYLPQTFTTIGQFLYTVTITLSGSGCDALTTQNALIDIVADPVVSIQPVSAAYCQNGSPVTPLSVVATGGLGSYIYQWYSNTSNSNSGGTLIPGATSSTYTPSVAAIGTTHYYCSITQTGLNCNVTSNTASIVVNQAPAFIDQPISQTICIGGAFTPLSVTYQFGTGMPSYQWYSNSVNSYTGAVAISGATNPSFQPAASTVSNVYYFCEIAFSFGGCTSISSVISNQIVVNDPIIASQPLNSQTICVGGTITSALLVNVTGGTGTTTYQWFAGSNAISGATQNSFVPSIYNNPGIYNYTVNISSSGVGCAALTSQVATVEVLADPLVSAPVTATYCQNASPVTPLTVNVTGGAGTNAYQWYASATNTTTAGAAISNATSSSYTPPVSTVGTVYYYCIVTQSIPNCANTSLNAPIQVNIPPTISVQPLATQTLCEGGGPTPLQIAYINGTNSATYQWYSNNINSNTGGTPIVNETNPTYTPPSILTGTVFYYCVITFQQGGCSSLTSISAQVTVVNDPAISLQPLAAQEICQGNTINNPLTFNYTGGTGNSTIAWYLDVNPPILINGITTSSYLPIPFNIADTFNYYATLTFDGVGCNVATTQLASIIVHPTPYVTNLDDTLVLCNNGVLDIPLTASVTSTFQWDTPQTSFVNGESFLTQTSYSIDDSLSNTTMIPQFLTYSVTPTSFPYGCVGPDSTVVVQVQPDVILSMNQTMEICSGSPVNGILTSNIPSTFNWFVSIDNPNVTGESILPSTNWLVNDVLVNTSTVNQVVIYSVFPVSIQGSCPGLAQPLVVTVKPPIDILNPDTLTICSGSNVGINLVANTNVQFNWYASPSLNVLNETTSVVSSATINDILVNPTNAVEIVTYNVIGTSTANGCSSPVLPLYVVVNPIPSLVNLNPLTICNGNYLYPYSIQTSVTGATTNWSVLNNPIGIPSSFGSNTLPGFIATNNTVVTQTGQILITPIFTNNNVTCIGMDTTLLIPVLPTPSVNSIADIEVCNLEQVPLTPVTGPVPNTYFEWINANIGTGLNATGIGDIPIFVGLNPGTAPLSGTVSITPYYTQNNVTCQGTPIDFDITVNPSPVLINNNIEICDQEFTNILLNANISSSFIWNAQIQPNVYNETAAPIQTTALINDQLVLATTTQQTVIYNVTPISTPYGCYGNDTTIEVIVHPLPVVDFTVITPILCDQAQINFQNNSVGSLDYTWTFGDGDSSFLFNPVHEYADFGSYFVHLEATDQITGCYNQDSQVLTINESPEADFILSDSIACGSLDVVFNALDLNPNWTYLWTFGDGTNSNQYGLAGHQYVTNGCFDVTLQITTPQGCISDTTQLDAVCIYPEPIAAFTMDDPVISSLTPEVQFFNSSLYADTYFWDFGDGTSSITANPYHLFPSDPATYVIVLTASNQIGCQDTAALTVTVWQDLAIYVPNTFTPDDDEYNQTFKPVLTEGFKKDSYHLMIFNRWGQVVFESSDVEYGWDGSYDFYELGTTKKNNYFKEMISPAGTYTWKIEISELQSGETRKFLGHVNLIR
jgi:gliding motility-associated-like protein